MTKERNGIGEERPSVKAALTDLAATLRYE